MSLKPNDYSPFREDWAHLPERYRMKVSQVKEVLGGGGAIAGIVNEATSWNDQSGCSAFIERLRRQCKTIIEKEGVQARLNRPDDSENSDVDTVDDEHEPDTERSNIFDHNGGDPAEWLETRGIVKYAVLAHKQKIEELRDRAQTFTELIEDMLKNHEKFKGHASLVFFGSMSYGAPTVSSDLDAKLVLANGDDEQGVGILMQMREVLG